MTLCHMRGCSMRIFVTCVALKTARGFVVLSEFEVHSRLLLTQGSVVLVSYVVAAKLSFLTCHLIIVYFRKYFRIKQRVSFITSRARRANKHRAVLSLFRLCLVSSALALALALFSPRLRPHLPSFPPFPVLALLSAPGFAASYAPALLSRRCVACTFID